MVDLSNEALAALLEFDGKWPCGQGGPMREPRIAAHETLRDAAPDLAREVLALRARTFTEGNVERVVKSTATTATVEMCNPDNIRSAARAALQSKDIK